MRLSPPLFLLLAGLVSGCAQEQPFVDHGVAVTVQKAPTMAAKNGAVNICHSDRTPWSEVAALADEQCAVHGLKAALVETNRWQCRATSPHNSHFSCVDPAMRNADGTYVNPFSRTSVAAWEKRTGQKAPAYGAIRGPQLTPPAPEPAGTLPGPAAPPPAPLSSAVPPPLTPDDIAGKPTIPSAPLPMDTPPPPPAAAPVDGGFKLPVGSWSDSFQE